MTPYLEHLETALLHAPTEDDKALIVGVIANAPARDLGDILVKIRALAWCRGGEPAAPSTTDERIIESLIAAARRDG